MLPPVSLPSAISSQGYEAVAVMSLVQYMNNGLVQTYLCQQQVQQRTTKGLDIHLLVGLANTVSPNLLNSFEVRQFQLTERRMHINPIRRRRLTDGKLTCLHLPNEDSTGI